MKNRRKGREVKKIIILISFSIAMSGCAYAGKTFGPDGQQAFNIDCSGSLLNWGSCYQKAGKKCGSNGYEILEKTGDKSLSAGGSGGSWGIGALTTRTILVACKEAPTSSEID
jgi:hypothetical protein